MTMEGLITDIQRCSLHDGPGLRTTVFFKGCPLRCAWCHNPESIRPGPETLYYPDRCIGCGMCEQGCFAGAKVPCGTRVTDAEILAQVMLDAPYSGGEGGVTLSGGEPLMQPGFALAILEKCREKGIHTAVETCLYAAWEQAEPVLAACSLVMADLKAWDSAIHRRYTGTDNGLILMNLQKLDGLNVPLLLRTPVIPGVNDTPEEIAKIAAFAGQRHHLAAYELLPYHPLGLSKAAAVAGWQGQTFPRPSQEQMMMLAQAAAVKLGRHVRIAGVNTDSIERGNAS